MSEPPATLLSGALKILTTAAASEKATLSRVIAASWQAGRLPIGMPVQPPDTPARPARPELRQPRDMPKRRAKGGTAGKIALLHALAHIELNAIDLIWDLIARFPALGPQYYDDWVRAGDEEAKHFMLLSQRLDDFGAAYGDLPAHDGLWQLAESTSGDVYARLALVPMVMEARGLDVTPRMIVQFDQTHDTESADILRIIYRDEITHVDTGRRWLEYLCARDRRDPLETWQNLVRRYYRGALKRPFNDEGRAAAGLPTSYYEPLAEAVN